MAANEDPPPRGSVRWVWAPVAVILGAAILIFDFLTKGVGAINLVEGWVMGTPEPKVTIETVERGDGPTCLQFAFSDLPRNFSLGKIELTVAASKGPQPFSGNMAAGVEQIVANVPVSALAFADNAKIEFRAAFQAERDQDQAIVDFCPILGLSGMQGTLHVVPVFLELNGDPIATLSVDRADGKPVNDGIPVSVARPKNAVVEMSETRFRIVSQ